MATPGGLFGTVVVLGCLASAICAPLFLMDPATTVDPTQGLLDPSLEHPLGTDQLGRDLLARVLVATRLTLLLAFGALAISTVVGVVLGIGVAMLGELPRKILFQVTSAATAFPAILVALLLAGMLGRSGTAAMVGLAIAGIPSTARLALNLASSIMDSEFVRAAHIVGVRPRVLLTRYLLPNIAEPLVTLTIISAGQVLIAMSALSFVGIGVQEPRFDWGTLLDGALANIYTTPLSTIGPALAVILTGVGFNLLGEALAAGLDPKARVQVEQQRGPRSRSDRAIRRSGSLTSRGRSRVAPHADSFSVERSLSSDDLTPISSDIAVSVEGLMVSASQRNDQGGRPLVDDVSITVARGERLGIVGESGSGKTLTLNALAGLVPPGVNWRADRHQVAGTDVTGASSRRLDQVIAARLPMIFQDPMGSLNPSRRIGNQLVEKLRIHTDLSRREARERAAQALESVGIDHARRRLRQYPYEFSGGMRQRVMIAMATLLEADVILADEPTTALDVSVQAQVIELLIRVTEDRDTALVLVSHDLALVSQVCDRIVVMYGGRILEEGPTDRIIEAAEHPYTRLLLGAIPDPQADSSQPLTTIPRGAPADVTDLAAWERLEQAVRDEAHERAQVTSWR